MPRASCGQTARKSACRSEPVGRLATKNKGGSGTYRLRVEEEWSSWGKSGVNHSKCNREFSSVAEAVKHAPNLIEMFSVFDDEGYGEILVDYRDDPANAPGHGVILSVHSEDAITTSVIIERID